MDDIKIIVPPAGKTPRWCISAPWLKLCLKYGLEGPWGPANVNRSFAFDRYALSRGPRNGPPTVADLAVTLLMNSGVTGDDIALASEWLERKEIAQRIDAVSDFLNSCQGLQNASPQALAELGELLKEADSIQGIGTAKAAKWFSAWAPAHVPMIDQYVMDALIGRYERNCPWVECLDKFRNILLDHFDSLNLLGRELSSVGHLSAEITPVRILDSLLWFDWWAVSTGDFAHWITTDQSPEGFLLTDRGRAFCEAMR